MAQTLRYLTSPSLPLYYLSVSRSLPNPSSPLTVCCSHFLAFRKQWWNCWLSMRPGRCLLDLSYPHLCTIFPGMSYVHISFRMNNRTHLVYCQCGMVPVCVQYTVQYSNESWYVYKCRRSFELSDSPNKRILREILRFAYCCTSLAIRISPGYIQYYGSWQRMWWCWAERRIVRSSLGKVRKVWREWK